MLFLLHANVLIRAHEDYYAIDRVPQFWNWLRGLAEDGHVKMPFEIHNEIAISNGPLKDFVCSVELKKALILEEEVNMDVVEAVLAKGYGDNLTDSELEKIGQDPFLVAYGLIDATRVIVTKEVSKPSKQRANRRLPDICNDLSVTWMKDFDFFKVMDFKTV